MATMDYEVVGFRAGNLGKFEILVAGDVVDSLTTIVHRQKAYAKGKAMVKRLHKLLPR
jgi:GTP-binding protein LepA